MVGVTISSERDKPEHALNCTYEIRRPIRAGATSFTFLAKQSGTHRDRTLKIFRPGTVTWEELDSALQRRAAIRDDAIPEIIEAGQISLSVPGLGQVTVPCVVLAFIDSGAITFSEYLDAQENLNQAIFERFIERVAGALSAIESANLSHGDLHERNILVVPGVSSAMARDFFIIDFVGVPSANSRELYAASDMENFRNHLIRAAIAACERYPGVSARLLL